MRFQRLIATLTLLAITCFAISILAQRPGLKPRVFAIRDARIVTEPGKEIAKGTIVIRDGVIAEVGESVTPPADALVIDGKGLTVYPGFIDACSTWGIDFALRRSETGPPENVDYAAEALAATKADNRKGMTPEFEVATALKVDEEAAESWRKQGFTARLAAPDGGILAGQSAFVSMSGAVPREAVMRTPIAQHAAFKTTGPGYPNTLMGIMAHFRQTLYDAGHHTRLVAFHEKEGAGKRPPLDPALTAVQPMLNRKQTVIFEADSMDEVHRALDFCDEFHLKPMLFGGADAWKAAERLKLFDVPVIVRLNFPDQPRSATPRGRRGPPAPPTPTPPADPAEPGRPRRQTPPAFDPAIAFATPESDDAALPKRVQEDNKRKHKEEMSNSGMLAQKGVRIALSANGLEKPEQFREKLAKAIENGLPPEAALRALTIDAARILGVERQLGTLSKGKSAHLIAIAGDFQDPKAQVRHVFADGVHFEYDYPTPPRGERKPGEGKRAETKTGDKRMSEEKKPDEEKKPEEKPDASGAPEFATEIEADRVPKTKTGGSVLIKNATILTVANGTVKGDILVEKGKIAQIGEKLSASMAVPVIDATGMFVMPGIIDTHSHFAMGGGINEGTLSVVPEVRCRDIINSEDVQIFRGLAGGVTTARLLHGSANVIGGQDAVIKLKYGEPANKLLLHESPRGVKFALGENVKRTDGRFPNTRLGVEAVLIRAFTEAQEYKREWEQYRARSASKGEPPPRRDLRLEALADILDKKLFVHSHCYRSDEILMLLRVAEQFGFRVKSLQHVLEGYKIAAEIAAHGASCSTFSDWWAYKLEAFDAIPWNAALLQEAGANVCMKSDSNELMRHLYQEAAKAMKYGGVSENDALKMVTLNAATQLGLEKRLGSIEVGKDADLAIFNAHPLDSLARCDMTLVDGEVYFQRPSFEPQTSTPVPTAKRGPDVPIKRVEINSTGSYQISGVMIHDGTNRATDGSVHILNGKIAGISRELPDGTGFVGGEMLPKGTTRINAKGLHLYPGMIDAGTIVGLTEIGSWRETQDYAEGGDFQPDLRASIGINPDSEIIPVTRANGVLTVVTRPTGAVIAGQSALVNMNGWVPSEMVLVDRLALQIDFPTTIPMFSSDPSGPSAFRMIAKKQRDEKIRRMKELFKQALAFDTARKAQAETPVPPNAKSVAQTFLSVPGDPRLEALIPYAKGEKPVIITANRRADILEAIKLADELKLKMILSGGTDAWKVTDELKKRDIPVLLGPIMALPAEPHDPYDAAFTCAAKLHQAGVRFCIRSPGGMNARNLPYEAAMAASYGLPLDEALKSVTLYPAQILGVADRLGSIEKGKLANLVLTDGDILQATTQVHAVFIAGVPVEPTSKQTRLYERYRQRLKEVKEGRAKMGTK